MAGATHRSPLLEEVRATIRVRHYRIRTEEAYLLWMRRFVLFHGKHHPRDIGAREAGHFLSYLAVEERVSASTQNQALNAPVLLVSACAGAPARRTGRRRAG